MGKDNRVSLDEFDDEELEVSSKDKKAAKIRAELEKKQREKRQKNIESKNKHLTGEEQTKG
jgi:hypothetical protein